TAYLKIISYDTSGGSFSVATNYPATVSTVMRVHSRPSVSHSSADDRWFVVFHADSGSLRYDSRSITNGSGSFSGVIASDTSGSRIVESLFSVEESGGVRLVVWTTEDDTYPYSTLNMPDVRGACDKLWYRFIPADDSAGPGTMGSAVVTAGSVQVVGRPVSAS